MCTGCIKTEVHLLPQLPMQAVALPTLHELREPKYIFWLSEVGVTASIETLEVCAQ